MSKSNPFKNAEVNPEPPKRDWDDFIELTLSVLWFHHKAIIGFILVAAVGFWIYWITTSEREVADREPSPGIQNPAGDDVPSAKIDVSSAGDDPANGVAASDPSTNKPDPSTNTSDSSPASDATEANQDANTQTKNDDADKQSRNSNRLLETGTVIELIEESLKLHDTWGSAVPSVGLIMCAERAKISQRLLELELTEAQRVFAISSYIESISLVDSLNVASEMNLPGTREALSEIDEKYSNHPNPAISVQANLAMTLAPIYDFMKNETIKSLDEFQTQFNQRIEKIARDPGGLSRLADVSIAMYKKTNLPDERKPVIQELMTRLSALEAPSAQPVAQKFHDQYLFDQFELNTIVDLVLFSDKEAQQKVQSFFRTLAENPDSGINIYDNAINIAHAYRKIGQLDTTDELLNRLDHIANGIPVEENRRSVKKKILELRTNW